MKARLPLIAAFAVALTPLPAWAQAWLSNPDLSEGSGFRAGNFEIHPSFGGEFGYDNNYFRASGTSAEEEKVGVYTLRMTPSVTLSSLSGQRRDTPTPPSTRFKAGAYLSYNQIFPADSANKEASEQSNFGAGADAKLDIFPEGKYGADVMAAYTRTLETDGTTGDLAGDGFKRALVRGAAGVTWRPGAGVFDWRLGYGITYNYFIDDDFESLDNVQHQIGTRGRWRFLPRSAVMFEAGYSFVRYTAAPDDTTQTDGDAVRVRMGYQGLVTYHLSLMAMLGWAASFYKEHAGSANATQFDSLVANAEARWFIMKKPDLDKTEVASGLSSIAVGYSRDFGNSYYGSFYQRDRGYLQFNMFLLGALSGGLEFGVARMAYPEVQEPGAADPTRAFAQVRYDGRVFAEYHVLSWLGINGTFSYDQVNDPGAVPNTDLSYSRWQAFVGVRAFW